MQRKNSGEDYDAFVRHLAEASELKPPPREELIEFDRKRKPECCSDPGSGQVCDEAADPIWIPASRLHDPLQIQQERRFSRMSLTNC